jgi:predicted Fe-Mo cluster-binding NifX family protein
MDLRFAFAVNNNNQFEKKHFGDADKYLVYQLESDKIVLSSDEPNRFKLLDEKVEHGSKRKGKAIIEFLKEKNVNVLVSQQFGKNIKLINEHFIPVKISSENPDEVIQILIRHIHWIKDEWEHNKSNFKLFTIKAGILKSSISK